MKRIFAAILTVIVACSFAACSKKAEETVASANESALNTSEASYSEKNASVAGKPDVSWADVIKSVSIQSEAIKTVNEIMKIDSSSTFKYMFISDMHIDSKQNEGNIELIMNTIDYAKLVAEKGGVDLIVLGGDQVSGWYDKNTCLLSARSIADRFEDSKVPVMIVKGNHDLNHNTSNSNNSDDWVTEEEFFIVSQAVVKRDNYVYDDSVQNGLYFYIDFPEKKTRAICMNSVDCPQREEQLKWLAEKVFTVKDEGWQYVLMMHHPVDIRYESDGMTGLCSGSDDIKKMITALNSGSTASCSFGKVDFTEFKSKVSVCSSGHTHSSYMELNESIGAFFTVSGCAGAVGIGTFDHVTPDDEQQGGRNGLNNESKNRYLFDVFCVNSKSIDRIRFGNGINKKININ